MSKSLSKYSIVFIFLGVTALAFFLGIVSSLMLWGGLQLIGVQADFWSVLSATSTAIAAAGVFGTVIVAYHQLSEVYDSRYVDVANKLFDELNSAENIEARRWVFQQLPADPEEGLKTISLQGRAAVKKVLNSLDHVAFLTQAGWIPEDLVMPWMHPMIAKSWFKLKPYVEYERKKRNEPYYYDYASRVAERCTAWRKIHIPNADEIKWDNDAL